MLILPANLSVQEWEGRMSLSYGGAVQHTTHNGLGCASAFNVIDNRTLRPSVTALPSCGPAACFECKHKPYHGKIGSAGLMLTEGQLCLGQGDVSSVFEVMTFDVRGCHDCIKLACPLDIPRFQCPCRCVCPCRFTSRSTAWLA